MAANLGVTAAPAATTSVRASSAGGSHRAADGERPNLDFAAMVRGGVPAEVAAEASLPRSPAGTMETSSRAQRLHSAAAASTSAAVAGAGASETGAAEVPPVAMTDTTDMAEVDAADEAPAPAAAVTGDGTAVPAAEREPGTDALPDFPANVDAKADAESTGTTGTREHADDLMSTDGDAGTDNARVSSVVSAPVVAPVGPAQTPPVTQPMAPTILPSMGSNSLFAAAAKTSSPPGVPAVATSATTAAASPGIETASTLTFEPTVPAEAVTDVRGIDDVRPLSGLLESLEGPSNMLRLEAPSAAGRAASVALPMSPVGGPLPTIALAVDGGDGQWLQGMAQDIVQLQEAGETRLRFNLAPAHLGSLQVELQQTDLGMELRVVADSASARDLLQSHGADLRQRFAEAGMHLAQFHCGTGGQPHGSAHSGSAAGQGMTTAGEAGDDIPTLPAMRPLAALRLLDLYA